MTAANRGRGCGRRTGIALALALGLSGPAGAAEESAVLLLRAEQLASEGRCAEALPVVRQVREQDSGSARAALLEGECYIRELRYAEAIVPLEDARRLDPELSRVALNLGVAHFQVGNTTTALRELDEAVRVMPGSAEAHLYRGLVLLSQADAAGAAAALEKARSLDTGLLDPAASYYAGRAFQMMEKREEAEQALERAIAQAPGSPWAEEAARALDNSRSMNRRRGFWARLSAGMEYDSNVLLLNDNLLNATFNPDQEDGRGIWYSRVGAELYRDDKQAGGLLGTYYGSAHIEADAFDTQFPTVAAYYDRQLSERSFLRLQPEFGYAWLDYEDYLAIASFEPSLHRAWESAGNGRFFFRFEHRDYLFSTTRAAALAGFPSGAPFNRDGQNYIGGYEHSYPLSDSTELRGALGANHYDSEQGEFTYVAPSLRAGVGQGLPFDSSLALDFLYRHEFYENFSAFAQPAPGAQRREDDVYDVRAVLEKRLTDNLLVSAHYQYTNNESNVQVFDYDRHIAGALVTLEFGAR